MLGLMDIEYMLTEFVNNHSLITEVYFMDDNEFNAIPDINYGPVVNITHFNSVQSGIFMNYNYVITICDKINPDYSLTKHTREIISDCTKVGGDFMLWLYHQPEFKYQSVNNISTVMEPFGDLTNDRTAGIRFNISIPVHNDGKECELP